MSSRKYPKADNSAVEALAELALDEIHNVFKKANDPKLCADTLLGIQAEVNCIMLEQLIASPETRALLSHDTIVLIERHLELCK
jgi:hypothetical protein